MSVPPPFSIPGRSILSLFPPLPPKRCWLGLVWILAACPREPEPEPGALAAVPATYQNHKQTLLPSNTTSPQHPCAESRDQSH